MRFVHAAFVLLAASLLSSGCVGGVFVVKASSPLVLQSYAYDGRGGRELDGTLEGTLYGSRNMGTIVATYRDAVDESRITWVNFTGRFPYQSEGVATEIMLFGDSENGPSSLPRVWAYAAAWGSVEFHVDDVLQPDPVTLFQTMDAVFFVSQGTYRDNETRNVAGRDGTGTYDPNRPGESGIDPIGAMAVIMIFTHRGDLFRLVEFSDVEIVAS